MRGRDKLERLSKTGLTYEQNDGIKVNYLKYGTQGHAQILDCHIKRAQVQTNTLAYFDQQSAIKKIFLTLTLRACFSKLFAAVINSIAEKASVFVT